MNSVHLFFFSYFLSLMSYLKNRCLIQGHKDLYLYFLLMVFLIWYIIKIDIFSKCDFTFYLKFNHLVLFYIYDDFVRLDAFWFSIKRYTTLCISYTDNCSPPPLKSYNYLDFFRQKFQNTMDNHYRHYSN